MNKQIKTEEVVAECKKNDIKITKRREIIISSIIKLNHDGKHPDAEQIYIKTKEQDSSASIATVYRFLSELDEKHIIEKHNFGDGKARYEFSTSSTHHDHLIDTETNEIIEFFSFELEKLKEKIAREYGYTLLDHRLELRGKKQIKNN